MARAVFHCELAWLGGDVPAGDVRIDTDEGRITAVEAGVAPPPAAVRLAGLTLPEIVEITGTSERTLKRDWVVARAFLVREIGGAAAVAPVD